MESKRLTNDLEDTVDGSNMRKESVSESSSRGGAGGESGNVDAGEKGRDLALGLEGLEEPVESGVVDGYTTFGLL